MLVTMPVDELLHALIRTNGNRRFHDEYAFSLRCFRNLCSSLIDIVEIRRPIPILGRSNADKDNVCLSVGGACIRRIGKTPSVFPQQYIESLFGPCRLSEAERKQAEAFLCTGSDAGCRLWFAGGNHTAADMPYMNNGPAHDPHTEKEAEDARHRMQHQYERNRSYLETHKLLIDESIKKLS